MDGKRPKVAVFGCTGMLGWALLDALPRSGFEAVPIPEDKVDIRDAEAVENAVAEAAPAAVINAAAYTDVDGCESNVELARAVNADGAANVARAASDARAALIHISTDYVFGGGKKMPLLESEPANPQGVYANTKWEGEKAVRQEGGRWFIIRTSWLFGPNGRNFVDTMLRLGSEREEISVVNDQEGSPTYTVHLAAGISRLLDLYISRGFGETGIYHLTAAGHCDWHEFASRIFEACPGRVKNVKPISTYDYVESAGRPVAPRPAYSVLNCDKIKKKFGIALPRWEVGLMEFLDSKTIQPK